MTCYSGHYAGHLQPAAEIAEVLWLTYRHRPLVSAVDQIIFDWLRAQHQLAD
ncbi:hypothetical protein [Hymenobacter sp. AT01-02]|uniref:hypothetical protein n=1 Tax=Hymenobacter sp. AT01-02 TaxID=1571877 RepID=UPI000A5C1B28|nr:hypothetical protein [Hymenobacter sp. AT01-02]